MINLKLVKFQILKLPKVSCDVIFCISKTITVLAESHHNYAHSRKELTWKRTQISMYTRSSTANTSIHAITNTHIYTSTCACFIIFLHKNYSVTFTQLCIHSQYMRQNGQDTTICFFRWFNAVLITLFMLDICIGLYLLLYDCSCYFKNLFLSRESLRG